MTLNRQYINYVIIFFALFSLAIGFAGYYEIGLLSDDYLNINGSIHSTLQEKLTGNLPFTNSYHMRTAYYVSMQSSNTLNHLLGFEYDNFVLYRIQNLLLFLIFAFIAGKIVLLITNHLSVSLFAAVSVVLFPNNINNICWTAARVDLLCGIFFLLALYFAFKCMKESDGNAFLSCILSYIAALFTKETAMSIPVITAILAYAVYGKEPLRKFKMIFIVQFGLIALYIFYKLVILGNNPLEMVTLYQSSPFANAPGIIARSAIALSVPLDFLSLNIALRNKEFALMLYLAVLYGSLFYIISVMVRNYIYRYITYMALTTIVLILPNIYIGYIRTQMILIPFAILVIVMFWAYDHQLKKSIHINKLLLKVFFVVAILFWGYWSLVNISDWKFAYDKSVENVKELMKTAPDENKRTIIIGNPGRYKQAFLFDKLTGAYNYWKTKDFVIKDTINDIVQTGALDRSSLVSKLDIKEFGNGEFEINTTGENQYFYIEGMDNQRIKEGFRSTEMSVEFTEYDVLNKPTKLHLKLLKPEIKCYLSSELKFKRIF